MTIMLEGHPHPMSRDAARALAERPSVMRRRVAPEFWLFCFPLTEWSNWKLGKYAPHRWAFGPMRISVQIVSLWRE